MRALPLVVNFLGKSDMEERYKDETIRCVVCDFDFIWTAGEQQYWEQHQLSRPKRCTVCRRLRREQAAQRGEY